MPSQNWGCHKTWPMKENNKIEHKVIVEDTLKEKLEKMSMNEIRTWAKSQGLKSKDTDKTELIEE